MKKDTSFLPSATKLRRLCFYKRVSVNGGGGVPEQVSPLGPGTPPWTRYTPLGPGTSPGTRYIPRDQVHPWDQVHPPGPGTPQDQVHPLGPGTPPGTRYPLDQVHPLGPGTPPGTRYPPWTRYTPRTRYIPPGPGTPPWDQVHPPGPGTPPPRYGHCCGRYASYWNAFLCKIPKCLCAIRFNTWTAEGPWEAICWWEKIFVVADFVIFLWKQHAFEAFGVVISRISITLSIKHFKRWKVFPLRLVWLHPLAAHCLPVFPLLCFLAL